MIYLASSGYFFLVGRWRKRMLDLGREHAQRGIPAKYLDLMGPTFCSAIRLLL
jgi:hypothetical protein